MGLAAAVAAVFLCEGGLALQRSLAPPRAGCRAGHRRALLPRLRAAPGQYLDSVPEGPPDPILGLSADFKADASPDKVNLVVGAYRDKQGLPWVLPSVKAAEQRMADRGDYKEYSTIAGDSDFVRLALEFAYGAESEALGEGRVAGVQTLSGTGACRIGGTFFAKFIGEGTPIYLSSPTWGNHVGIMKEAGLDVQRYRYFDSESRGLDFEGMVEDLTEAPEGSIVLLHACAHNPTGVDPTLEQWKAISDLCKERGHHIFFDSAYQGFASGDSEADAAALRLFVSEGHVVALAQSFAKNFGLYGERVGTFSLVCRTPEEASRVMSQLKLIIRPMYSSPPIHGSGIVKEVLGDTDLRGQYVGECASMADRIKSMRKLLRDELEDLGSSKDWSHITDQIGMFAFTGMTNEMVDRLIDEYHIFLTKDGRISIAGINPSNVKYVAGAIHAVTSN